MPQITLQVSGNPTGAVNAPGGGTSGLAGAQQAQATGYAAHKAALAAAAGAPPPAIAQLSAADMAAKQAQAAAHDTVMAATGGDYENTAAVASADQISQQVAATVLQHAIANGVSADPGTMFNPVTNKVPDLEIVVDTDSGAILSAKAVAAAAGGFLKKFESVGTTLAAGAVGALAGGPIGLAVGLAGGGLVDIVRARAKKA